MRGRTEAVKMRAGKNSRSCTVREMSDEELLERAAQFANRVVTEMSDNAAGASPDGDSRQGGDGLPGR